ncbi:histidine kinase [Methanobrevibacter arboriphilus]|jgi:predicted transcriptional regulator|uniref:Histidine kinase n=1 Tax=Methanobrevibacter arboriphilus TaxID=39441 RepID=A0ACA8R1W4_METAZ|nr:CBS domain-containing protein [Methanobrevibacter arboriphilus]BBL61349.1 histidine kinase [Methanobrevibacter arboriphilus]GLI11317.1 histidine kinase [Methanobrevibacter arboriphilus]
MKIKDVMNQEVISVNEQTSPIEAFEKMYRNGVRRLFVIDDNGTPKGVVSYSDLIGVLNKLSDLNKENNQEKIKNIMTTNIMTVNSEEDIKNAANLMLRADVSGLLVIKAKKPVGVITKTDICRLVAANLLIPKNDD